MTLESCEDALTWRAGLVVFLFWDEARISRDKSPQSSHPDSCSLGKKDGCSPQHQVTLLSKNV